ncbi:MAG TPA: hypothetical protein VJ866_02940 [Pyrinomonadaceae bacterium]|nr:hypothetical protein [Pyrinomonadaceae bacterium]
MKRLGRRRWLILIAFLLAASFAGLFAVRTVRHALYWSRHRDEAIRPWMSVPYVARSYRVPPPVLYRAINLEPVPRDRRPLREIALEQNRPVEALAADLEKVIGEFRAHPERFPPPPPPHQSEGRRTP